MTDLKPGSRWLLPVVIVDISTAPYGFLVSKVCGKQTVRIDYPDTLIPADRITELEAEVARLKSELEKLNAHD